MTFDNSRKIISLRIKLFTATLIFLAYIAVAYIGRIIKFPVFGMSDTLITIALVVIYLFIAFLPVLLDYQYFSYSDEGDKITFRYFTAGIVGGRKNSVEIDKRLFAGYSTEKKLFGLKESIILFQQLREGVAKYPPIYISALSKEQKSKMIRSLNLLAPTK
jgi:hypothetical protein